MATTFKGFASDWSVPEAAKAALGAVTAAQVQDATTATSVAIKDKIDYEVPPLVSASLAADDTPRLAAEAAVSNAAADLELVESILSPAVEDVEGGITDQDGRITWLTHDAAGGPTGYARDSLGLVDIDAELAGGFVDENNAQTDLVFGADGHVPVRIMALWGDRIMAAKGLVTTDTRVFWGHSLAWGQTNGATPIVTYLAGLLDKVVVNKGVGGELSRQIRDRVIGDQSYRAAVTYLWSARNDLNKTDTSPELAVSNIRRMLEHETPIRRKALVFEEPPWNGETYGSTARTAPNGLDAYNNAIKAAFPDFWVPLASWMLTDAAAASVGITFTAEDIAARDSGTTPPSFLSDSGHYNSLGNQAAAYRIHQEEQSRGWI